MKVCLIGPGIIPIPPNGHGAVESLMWEYTQVLRKLGHEVDIINIPDKNEIVRLENSKEYDVTHIHYDVFYDILPQLKARKVLISSHYPYVDQLNKHPQDDYGRIFKFMIENAHKYKIAAISAKDANCYTSHGVNPADVFVIPNGVNVDKFHYTNQIDKLSFAAICLAKIEQRKRQYLTYNLPNVYYIGRGPLDHINYLGEISTEEKEKILTRFGCMLLLSNGENGSPLCLKEGLAAGLNLICSENAASELYGLPFVKIIPEKYITDITYIQKIIIESVYFNLRYKAEIRKYCIENWSWEKLISDYVKKLHEQI